MSWWEEIEAIAGQLNSLEDDISESAVVEDLVDIRGPVKIGAGTKVCRGACIYGPVLIGRNCLIGNNCMIRGPVVIGDGVKIGFTVEVKNAIIEDDVMVGPLCFIADSMIRKGAYLGALVRTSNHRLDRETVKVLVDGELVDTGREKLGAYLGENSSLGVSVIILPGRMIAPGTIIGPRIIVEKNFEPGTYTLKQDLTVRY